MDFQKAPGSGTRGQELVEFALVVPLLMLIAFGVLDLGRLYHAAVTVTNATREGARYGTLNPADMDGVILRTQEEAQNSGIDLTDPATSTIEVTCTDTCTSRSTIRVAVTYDFRLIVAMVFPSPTIEIVRFTEMMVP